MVIIHIYFNKKGEKNILIKKRNKIDTFLWEKKKKKFPSSRIRTSDLRITDSTSTVLRSTN